MLKVPNICSKTFRNRSQNGTLSGCRVFRRILCNSSFFITETYSARTSLTAPPELPANREKEIAPAVQTSTSRSPPLLRVAVANAPTASPTMETLVTVSV
jgi:hypothetical protein